MTHQAALPVKYAIIDCETTGTSYKSGKITEIAILIHDGEKIIDEFSTFTIATTFAPFCLAISIASSVSAVSPD